MIQSIAKIMTRDPKIPDRKGPISLNADGRKQAPKDFLSFALITEVDLRILISKIRLKRRSIAS